jgi:hypothetical protein
LKKKCCLLLRAGIPGPGRGPGPSTCRRGPAELVVAEVVLAETCWPKTAIRSIPCPKLHSPQGGVGGVGFHNLT